jgi:hypothetical protein
MTLVLERMDVCCTSDEQEFAIELQYSVGVGNDQRLLNLYYNTHPANVKRLDLTSVFFFFSKQHISVQCRALLTSLLLDTMSTAIN